MGGTTRDGRTHEPGAANIPAMPVAGGSPLVSVPQAGGGRRRGSCDYGADRSALSGPALLWLAPDGSMAGDPRPSRQPQAGATPDAAAGTRGNLPAPKYEEVYLHAYATVAEAKAGIDAWLDFYNIERQHQSLGYRTPRQMYQEGLCICGRSALPTGCASPASRASSESGEMLAFAHIPTGTTINKGIDVEDLKSRGAAPATAMTTIGADIETGGATP